MIAVKNTPNNVGVSILGDPMDFRELYDAFNTVMGDEEEWPSFSSARNRLLGLCYDLRHAMMGDREFEFVDNDMDADKMKRLSLIAPNKNIYLKINVLWPEILFVTMALNDFLSLYASKRAKRSYDAMADPKNIWDFSMAQVRIFQAAVAQCIQETVSESAFNRMMNLMNKSYPWLGGYTTQYIDILNDRFMGMDRDKRFKSIATMAKRLAEQGEEYGEIRTAVFMAAREHNCSVENINPQVEYPENIEW